MSRNRFAKTGFVLLIGLLATSITFNVFLYRQGRDYYLDLNHVRLDPLGLASFPIESHRTVDTSGKPLVVFYGDSRSVDWPIPAQGAEMTFINRGIGAQTTAQTLGRFSSHVLPLKANTLVLQVGINDLKTIALFPEQKKTITDNCIANIQEIVQLATEHRMRVILTTIFPLGKLPIERMPFWSNDVADAIDDVNQSIIGMEHNGIVILDAAAILVNDKGIIDSRYSKDFLHLNPQGYDALNRALSPLLLKPEVH
jgi:lysophospholipase L1-like esterase